eukprot:666548-Prorocentrum_minimum.AAC.2
MAKVAKNDDPLYVSKLQREHSLDVDKHFCAEVVIFGQNLCRVVAMLLPVTEISSVANGSIIAFGLVRLPT